MRILVCIAIIATGAALASDPPRAMHGDFDGLDRDRNGRLSWSEFSDRVMDMFYFSDLDNDGLIGKDEAPPGLQRHWQDFRRDGDDRVGSEAFVAFHRARFDQADADGDGQLSRAEVDGLPRRGEGGRRR